MNAEHIASPSPRTDRSHRSGDQATRRRGRSGLRPDKGTPVGWPSLDGSQKHLSHVSFRTPAELRAKAEERAAKEGKTVSQLAREAFEKYLAS